MAGWNLRTAPQQFLDVAVAGLRSGALYGLIAIGYTLVYGIVGLINFAHGDLFMLASVFASILLEEWLGPNRVSRGWASAVVLAAVMPPARLINAATERVVYRRLREASRLNVARRGGGVQLRPPVGRSASERRRPAGPVAVVPGGGLVVARSRSSGRPSS